MVEHVTVCPRIFLRCAFFTDGFWNCWIANSADLTGSTLAVGGRCLLCVRFLQKNKTAAAATTQTHVQKQSRFHTFHDGGAMKH